MGGRFFQRLQQCVESIGREHVHFVDDVDLVARRGGPVMHGIDDLADVPDPGVRGGVHLHHIDVAALHDRHAMLASAAGIGGRSALSVRADAVHALGDDPRRGRLAGTPDPRHDKGLRDPVRSKGIAQGAHHGVLTDEVGKGLGSVFPGQYLVGRFRIAHLCLGILSTPEPRTPRSNRPPSFGGTIYRVKSLV